MPAQSMEEPGTKLKIRKRERRGYAREAGGYAAWTEYQVIDGRKIIDRFDTEELAKEFIRTATETGGENG